MTKRWQGNQIDYEHIQTLDHITAVPVCLTALERQLLMVVASHIGSIHRYYKPSDAAFVADWAEVKNWRNVIVNKLMGECAVDCTDVLACLRGFEGDDWDWLIDIIGSDSDVREVIEKGVSEGDTLIPGANEIAIDTCDKDELYGFTLQLVQLMNRLVLQGYEFLEVATNYIELLVIAADKIPLLAEVVDYASWIQDNAIENYEANYDVELEIEYACELMCLALINDCTLTWGNVLEYFQDKLVAGFAETDWLDWAQYILTGSWAGDEFCHLSLAMLALVLGLGGDWTGVRLETIQRIWQSFLNDPNEDWDGLCDCQDIWYADFDFTEDDCNFVIPTYGGNPTAVYITDEGYDATNWVEPSESDQNTRMLIQLPITDDAFILKVKLTISEYTKGGGSSGATPWAATCNGEYSSHVLATWSTIKADTFIVQPKKNYVTLGNTVDVRCSNEEYSGSTTVSRLQLWGKGTAPDEIQDNATEFVEY